MKKILFISIVSLCAITLQTNAQMRDTTVNMNMHKVDANSLFQKSKKQKTAAWILLGGGAGLATAGHLRPLLPCSKKNLHNTSFFSNFLSFNFV